MYLLQGRRIVIRLAFAVLLILVASASRQADAACTALDIKESARLAYIENVGRDGELWGTKICDEDSAQDGYSCYNACARVVSLILRKAGCRVEPSDSAGELWARLKKHPELKPSKTQSAGCVIAMNSRQVGSKGRLTLPGSANAPVKFRHLAVSIGRYSYIDNFSLTSQGKIAKNNFLSPYYYADLYMYEPPLYICPIE